MFWSDGIWGSRRAVRLACAREVLERLVARVSVIVAQRFVRPVLDIRRAVIREDGGVVRSVGTCENCRAVRLDGIRETRPAICWDGIRESCRAVRLASIYRLMSVGGSFGPYR